MKIHNKLFLILFSFSFFLVTALLLLVQWSIGRGMVEYVNSKEVEALKPVIVQLESEYKKNNDWSTLRGKHKKFGDLLFSNLKDSEFIAPPPLPEQFRQIPNSITLPPALDRESELAVLTSPLQNRKPRPNFRQRINYALLDNQQNIIVGDYVKRNNYSKTAITVEQHTVGWLIVPKRKKVIDGYELAFIEQQQSYLWIIALVTMLLVGLMTHFLARHLAGPIKVVISGMHKLTQGDYQQKIAAERKDELGELSRDFNELAMTLDENESARKRWLANISHELRTPVAILRGELEAMLDGVRPLNTRNISSANDEVKHLQHLIDDLHRLTSADIGGMHYRKQTEDLAIWLKKEADKLNSYLAAANISLDVDITAQQCLVFMDSTRLCQLFENIINNCIKYAGASRVNISLARHHNPNVVTIIVEDNGIGVDDVHLAHLFEHLYRVENSRNRKTGGSGLGLSICAHIVAAHQGTIVAEKSHLGGLAIMIKLPLSQ